MATTMMVAPDQRREAAALMLNLLDRGVRFRLANGRIAVAPLGLILPEERAQLGALRREVFEWLKPHLMRRETQQ